MENENKTVILNGKQMSESEFENEKNRLIEKKIQIVEISKNTYVTRMID